MPPPPELTSLSVRRVPLALMREMKAAAALQGQTLREWVIDALQEKIKSPATTKTNDERRSERELENEFDSGYVHVYGGKSLYSVEFTCLTAYEVRALAQVYGRMRFIIEDR
jgi:hypothetical protein